MRRVTWRTGCFLSISAALVGVGCDASPQLGDEEEVVGSTRQTIVPAADLCNPTTDQCSVAISVPLGVNMLDVALASIAGTRANDRVRIGSSGGLVPVIMSLGAGQSRVGADASVGHVWSAGDLEVADRATVSGQVVLDSAAPAPKISQIATIGGNTERQSFTSTSRTIWTVKWPSKAVSSLEATAAGTELAPDTDYGNVFVRSGQVLKLSSAGNYYIRNLTLDSGGKIQLANGKLMRLAIAGVPVLNGDVVVADQKDPAAPKFLMAVLSSGSLAVSGTFQGLLLAPKADVMITGYGNKTSPLPQRGAFWGRTTELHQGAALTQGVDPALFVNAGEGLIADDSTDPSSNLVKFVPSVGYLDGTSCDHWPKDLQRANILDSVLGGLPAAATSDTLTQLQSVLQSRNVSTLVSIGSNRGLTLASYMAEISSDGTLKRHWVAVDEAAGVGYDLSHQFLCTGDDVFQTAKTSTDPICKRQTMALNFGSTLKQVQVLRRVPTKTRTRDDAMPTVLLVAPTVRLAAPPDGYPANTLQLDVNVTIVAKNVTGTSTSGQAVALDVKPFSQTNVTSAATLAAEIKVPSRSGIAAVFADSISNVGMISTHNAVRIARYTPMDGLAGGQIRPIVVKPSAGAPADDVSVYSEYLFPKKWLLDYSCTAPEVLSTEATLTSPPDYFCQQWQSAPNPPSNVSGLKCTYSVGGTITTDYCAKAWCSGALKNSTYYNLSFIPKMTRESISCDATIHMGLFNSRYVAEEGGRVILAAGTGADSVVLRAPQGEATLLNYDFIRSVALESTINSDVLRALKGAGAFTITNPGSWPNPTDLSEPAQNPTTPRCNFTGSYYGTGASVTMNCGLVKSPFPLRLWTVDGFDAGQPRSLLSEYPTDRKTLNSAATTINSTTTYALLSMLAYEGPVPTYPQQVLKNATATAANIGAQVASGGDYFKLLDRWATNAAMPNAVPGKEFEQLRNIVGNLAPITVDTLPADVHLSALEISTAEKQRITAFADSYRAKAALSGDYTQPWQIDMTGTPYGNVLTGWLPPWFGWTNPEGSPTTLVEVKSAWDTARERATLFYALRDSATTNYEYQALYQKVAELTKLIETSATASAQASNDAIPSQLQALDTLKLTVQGVQSNMSTLNAGMRDILGVSDTATDQELVNAIANDIAAALAACSERNKPTDPFGAALSAVASFVPYVSTGVKLLDGITTALDKANQGTQYFMNFTSDGTTNYIDNWVNFSKPIIDFLKPVASFLKQAGDVASSAADVAQALSDAQYQGNCPTTDATSLAAKGLLLNLANQQSLVRVMQSQLSTIAGAIQAIEGNAEFYRASGSTMGQLASGAARLGTQLSDSQIDSAIKAGAWPARREALLMACQSAHTEIEARLPMLAQLSRSLVTTAGRATTPPGLMIPAWDNGTQALDDVSVPLPYNLWDPSHQAVVNSFMTQAWNRWVGSNHAICSAVVNGAQGGQLVFDLKKDLYGDEVTNFLKNGWVDFSVTLGDWLNAYAMDSNISPSVWRKDSSAWSALVSPPVVWDVAFQACNGPLPTKDGEPFDPCCDLKNTPCMTTLKVPDGSGQTEIVRMSAGWVPTTNPSCDSLSVETAVNPNYFFDNPRPPASNPKLFPIASQTCKSSVIVPAAYQPIGDVSERTRRTWAFDARTDVCKNVGPESMVFTPLRGAPLLGDWVLTNTLENAQLIARYNLFPPQDSSSIIVPPPATFAANNAGITAIRVLISAMAEPKATKGPVAYTLLSEYPTIK